MKIDYIVAWWVALIGIVLTLAYNIETIIEEKAYVVTSRVTLAFLLLAKATIGAIVIVLVYFALSELNIEFTVFTIHVKFGVFTNLFVASIFCLWGSDFYKTTQRLFKKKAEGQK